MIRLTIRLIRIIIIVLILHQTTTGLTEAKAATSEMNLVNLIVEGNETRTINDTTLIIEGTIEVRDNATLNLENVKVLFIESDTRHSFTVNNHSSLVLIESDVKIKIIVNQRGRLIASNSKLIDSNYCIGHEYNHTYGGVTGNAFSNITLEGCTIGYFYLHDNSQAQITDSFIYWSFPDDGKLTVKDSKIATHREILDQIKADLVIPGFTEYSGDLGEIIPGSKSQFENVSLIDGLWLHLDNSNITIHDSKFYFLDTENDSNIILVNVTLSRISNYMGSLRISVINCSIERLFSLGSNDTISIKGSRLGFIDLQSWGLELGITDSAVDELWMDDVWFGPFNAYIQDSTIGVFKPGLGNEEPNNYFMNNVTLLDRMGFQLGGWNPSGGINLHGGMRFGEGFDLNETVVDGYAVINRFFPVFFNSSSGPVVNVSLVLMNGNRTLWEGETSSDGVAVVPVRFVKIFEVVRPFNASGASVIQADNMTEVVSLFWSHGDEEGSIELELRSETPILVEISQESGFRKLLVPFLVILLIFYIINQSNK